MRILCVLDNFSLGGLQRHMIAAGKELVHRGHHFEFLLIGPGRMAPETEESQLPVLAWKQETLSETVGPHLKKFDLIFNTSARAFTKILDCCPEKIHPAVVQFCWDDVGPNILGWSRVSKIIVCNSQTRNQFINAFPKFQDRVLVLDNPVTIKTAPTSKTCAAWRRSHSIPQDAFLIGTLGRYTLAKRFTRLIKEVAPFLRSLPEAHLIIAGPTGKDDGVDWLSTYDPCAYFVEKMGLKDQVHLLEYQPNPEAVLAALDVYINMSESEGQSISVSEALWMGKPVITTAVGGTDRQINLGACPTGVLIPIYGPSHINLHLHDLYRERTYRTRLSENGRQLARTRFSLARYVDALEGIFSEACHASLVSNPINPRGLPHLRLLLVTYNKIHKVSPRVRCYFMQRCLRGFGVAAEIRTIDNVTLKDIDNSDMVVFHRVAQALLMTARDSQKRNLLRRRMRFLWEYSLRGRPTGYDLDDYIFLPDSEPMDISGDNLHFLETATLVIANSKAAARRFSKYSNIVRVIENPVNERLWDQRLLKRLGNKFTVGWIAGINHDNNAGHAYTIILELIGADKDINAVVLGGPKLPDQLSNADQVIQLPPIPWYKVPQVMVNFDVSLAPLIYNHENHSKGHGHICEPALLQIPSVVQDTESYNELVQDSVNGFTADVPGEWINKILALKADFSLRQEIGRTIYNQVLKRFGWGVIGQRYRQVLDEFIG